MTYKTILVHAQTSAEPRLATAAALARQHGARLIGVGAEMIQPLAFADPFGFAQGEWLGLMREQLDKDLDTAAAAFERHASGLDHEWRRIVDMPTQTLARCARSADIIVAGGAPLEGRNSSSSANIGELVVTAGRPILVAPPAGGELRGEQVLVAWKDTREARRAVADALPLLQRAEEVMVLSLVAEDLVEAAEFQTGDVVAWLKRHGVTARAKVVAGFDDDAYGEIQLQAMSAHADLIVAGGYGRTRFTEWVLGGVTEFLLADPQRFVFLSH
ncbi:MAG TPA: universal stress protein [Phenylobacterium sp.]